MDHEKAGPEVPLDQDIIPFFRAIPEPRLDRLQIGVDLGQFRGYAAPELFETRRQVLYLSDTQGDPGIL